jgi:hypothetical protein
VAVNHTFEIVAEGQRIQRLLLPDQAVGLRIITPGCSQPLLEVSLMRGFNGIITVMVTDPCDAQTKKKITTRLVKMEDYAKQQEAAKTKVPASPAAGAEVLPAMQQNPGRAVDRSDGHADPVAPPQDGGAQQSAVEMRLRESLLGD